jgi:hypothetical protein
VVSAAVVVVDETMMKVEVFSADVALENISVAFSAEAAEWGWARSCVIEANWNWATRPFMTFFFLRFKTVTQRKFLFARRDSKEIRE